MKWAILMKAPLITENTPFTNFFKACLRLNGKHELNTVSFQFKDEQTALSFFHLLKERLPLLNTEFPKVNGATVHLTDEQTFFCERLAMCESGKLSTDYLTNCLLKTLRADEYDYSYQFILGIIPGENDSRRLHNLRPFERKKIIIAPDGMIKPREHKQPMYSAKEKVGFSQAQSNTLLDPNAFNCAFGFNKDHRIDKLYGIVTHTTDSLFNRLLTNDSGTVARIFDYDSHEEAQRALSWLKGRLYTTEQIEEFREENTKSKSFFSQTNEVLARIRFNPYRTVVSICADTLEARLLAYDFAQELLDHYKAHAEKNNLIVNPNYKIPIIFYIRKKTISGLFLNFYHEINLYTDQMRKTDEAESFKIYSNTEERIKRYMNNDFEFLLGLRVITQDILLDSCLGEPLAYLILKNGYTRVLMRLLKSPALRDQVFDALISQKLFRKNDPIIANLILTEQFDLADKLITSTDTKKHKIEIVRSEFETLFKHLLHKGNPRQIQYMGLDKMLLEAADQNKWITVMLYLKEFTIISKETLSELFSTALTYRKVCESQFMFQKSAKIDEMAIEFFNVAIDHNNSTYVRSLLFNPAVLRNKALLGRALIKALRYENHEIVRALFNAGALPVKNDTDTHFIEGVLVQVLYQKLFEFIPSAIELEAKCNDEAVEIRYIVALQLLREAKNLAGISTLERFKDNFTVLNPKNIKIAICYLLLKALYHKADELAKTRLITLCHQYQLLPTNNTNIGDALNIVMEAYHGAITSFNLEVHGHIFYFLARHYLNKKNSDKLISLVTFHGYKTEFPPNFQFSIRFALYKGILTYLSRENIDTTKDFKHKYIDNEPDPRLKSKKSTGWAECLQLFFSAEIPIKEKMILLLFEVGLPAFKTGCAAAFKSLVRKRYLRAATTLLAHPQISDDEIAQCIGVLARHPNIIRDLPKISLIKIKPLHVTILSSKKYDKAKIFINELLKLDNANDYSALIIQFFNSAIAQKKWKDVKFFTSIPIILNNKTLLGSALKSAIRDNKSKTAASLIKKGARFEKLFHQAHLIEGVLYHALMSRFFDFIPSAIESEAQYNDDAAQIRYVVALQVAHELGNSSSISQLEKFKSKFEDLDPRAIKIAICFLFLNALSCKKNQLAEERVIKLCHHYRLLPSDNSNINDALNIIIEYYYDASSSISNDYQIYYPPIVISYIVNHFLNEKSIKKLIFLLTSPPGKDSAYFFCLHEQIYKSLLDHLSSDNVTTIRSFFSEYINNKKYNHYDFDIKDCWQSNLNKHFGSVISRDGYTEEQILPLFEMDLVLSEDECRAALSSFLKKGFIKAATKILGNPKLSSNQFDECWEVLKEYLQYIQLFEPFFSKKIKSKHIRNLCYIRLSFSGITNTMENIIAILKKTNNDPNHNNNYWDFYYTLDYSTLSQHLEIEKELARLLKPSIIKHMCLIFILDRFRCYLKDFHDNYSADSSVWPNLKMAFKKNLSLIDFEKRTMTETTDPQQSEILILLNNYFIDINAIPSEDQIETAYTKVMELFELATRAKPASASDSGLDAFNINSKFATYMRSLHTELEKYRLTDCQLETISPSEDENTDDNLSDIPVYYLR